jgi:hypothetical protein
MAEERVPVFELHILQMFRRIDREHMALRGADLTSYDYVKGNADLILRMLKENSFPMPERAAGGPWPKEWIDLFARWMQDFHRLSLGAGADYAIEKRDQDYRLTCNVMLPDPKARCWLEWQEATPNKLIYRLVLEPTLRVQPSPVRRDGVFETILGPLALPSVHVVDQTGMHEVAIPTA